MEHRYNARFLRNLAIALGICSLIFGAAFWWSNTPPARPTNVSSNAVFLWSGHVGLPAPRHGMWLSCWLGNQKNICRINRMDGSLEYEGVYVPVGHTEAVQERALHIIVNPTSNAMNWVRVDKSHGAPIVFLQGGDILIPQEHRSEALARLKEVEKSRPRGN